MSLRYAELQQVVAELNAAFAGAAIQKAWAFADAVFLEVRHRTEAGWRSALVQLQREPATARLSVVEERPAAPDTATSFQKWLRQELVGARISAVSLLPSDRVVRIDLTAERGALAIVAELTGGKGITALLGPEDRIFAFSGEAHDGRPLRPGATWTPPPTPLPEAARALSSRLSPVEGAALPLAAAAEALFGRREKTLKTDAVRRTLAAPVRARRTRVLRTLEKVRAEAARQPEAETHKRLGELLAQNLHRVPRGAKSVTLTEYTEAGPVEVTLKLDPTRMPKQEIDWRFHQYRRLLRGCEAAQRRLGELERELATVEAELAEIAALSDEALLQRAPQVSAPKKAAAQPARPYREFRAAKGERILVGKGSRENDTLTFKVARPQDLWLHVRGVPGSHVVIPLERGATWTQEVLLDAAHLALHYSQRKGEPSGEVSYTQAKFVRRQKDGPPGAVIYTREKTFNVRVEPGRIERLLRSREEAEKGE